MNYYRRFPGDYQSKTQDLDLAEHGIYNRLLDYQYLSEKPIRDVRHANQICALNEGDLETKSLRSWQRYVKKVFERYFPVFQGGGYWNKRVLEEISYLNRKRELAQKAALSRHDRDTNATRTRQKHDNAATDTRQETTANVREINANDMRPQSVRTARACTQTQTQTIDEFAQRGAPLEGGTSGAAEGGLGTASLEPELPPEFNINDPGPAEFFAEVRRLAGNSKPTP